VALTVPQTQWTKVFLLLFFQKKKTLSMIKTTHLLLRPPVAADLDAWAAFAADAEVMRFLGGVQARSAAWRSMAVMAGSWVMHGHGMWSVIERASGRWVGRIGPWCPPDWPGTEIGWGLAREAWGKGYGYEAAMAAMDYAVDVLGWTDIIHCINPENIRSAALAQHLGAVNRGPGRMPAPYENERIDIWGQSAADWRAQGR